jgi:hypothetical protein
VRQRLARPRTAGGGIHRDVAPAEDGQPLVGRQLGELGAGTLPFWLVDRQEREAGGVAARGGQLEPGDRAEERVGQLGDDAGAVAGVRVGARRAAVLKVAKDAQGAGHDAVAAPGPQVRDEADAAGVVLEPAVVKRALDVLSFRQVTGTQGNTERPRSFSCGRHHQHSCRHISAVLRLLRGTTLALLLCKLQPHYMSGDSLSRADL